jgi:hypothetical protein
VPRLLHLLTEPSNRTALDVLAAQARDPANRLAVVLLQEATALTAPLPGEVYRLIEDGEGGGSPYPSIDHARLLELIFSADTVVTW